MGKRSLSFQRGNWGNMLGFPWLFRGVATMVLGGGGGGFSGGGAVHSGC